MKKITAITFCSLFLMCLALTTSAQDTKQTYEAILEKFVVNGAVDYRGLVDEKANLDRFVEGLKGGPNEGSSEAEEMAFWINSYNALTLKLVVDHYPIQSIRDLHGGNPWDVKIITIGDEALSLNQIEKEKLLGQFKDARVHFAVNCAAKSCPPLSNMLFTESNLEMQLERLTKTFLANTDYAMGVSKIFEWYAADFGDVDAFIAKYCGQAATSKLTYQGYDWSLNTL